MVLRRLLEELGRLIVLLVHLIEVDWPQLAAQLHEDVASCVLEV